MRYILQTMDYFKELSETKDVVLFGAGEYAMRFINHIEGSRDRVKMIADNNPEKWGAGCMAYQLFRRNISGD